MSDSGCLVSQVCVNKSGQSTAARGAEEGMEDG